MLRCRTGDPSAVSVRDPARPPRPRPRRPDSAAPRRARVCSRAQVRLRPRRGIGRHAVAARRQGRRARRDAAHRRARPGRLHGHDRGLRRGAAATRPGPTASRPRSRRAWSPSRSAPAALGDPRAPAAGLGPLRRRRLDAGHDGHDPQPRHATRPSRGWPPSGNARFAWDSYRRFMQMYGEVVVGVPGDLFEHALSRKKPTAACSDDTDLDADDLRALGAEFRRLMRQEHRRATSPTTRASSCGAPSTPCSARWQQPARHRLPAGATASPTTSAPPSTSCRWCSATSATTRRPASASRATRRPASGSFGEFLVNAQGEDVVAGIRTPRPLARAGGACCRTRYARAARDAWSGSRSTTATCRTSSSRSSAARSTCCRRAPASAPRRPRCASRATWSPRA